MMIYKIRKSSQLTMALTFTGIQKTVLLSYAKIFFYSSVCFDVKRKDKDHYVSSRNRIYITRGMTRQMQDKVTKNEHA
jgi:hypothetical protein